MSGRISQPSPASPQLLSLADPPIRLMDALAMEYFIIELVNALRISSANAISNTKKIEQEMIEAGLIPPTSASVTSAPSSKTSTQSQRDSMGSQDKPQNLTEEEEALRVRLESIGMHVGANFTERLCRDRPLFSDTLDAVKFICKDLWTALWDKQVDNLRTNHRGVYVLQDNQFKPIARLSSWDGRADALKHVRPYIAMSGGIIKGALSRLGYQATVTPDVTSLPQCTFQVKLPKGS